jgi:CDP-alcohol phosphatidyltransferase
MSHSRPTIAELRAGAQKDRHHEIGNWLARRVGRPSAVYGSWLAIRLGLTPHPITVAALVSSLAGSVLIGTGQRTCFVSGVVLLYLAFWVDHVDGQVARWRGMASLDGTYLDYLMHHTANLALGFALGYGLAARSGDPRWTIAGLTIGVGWTLLSLHNDCRYKAFFQRLKSASVSFRVDGGRGGRPAPPAAWPRAGRAAWTWPAFKACEIHVVLGGLAMLAVVALALPELWIWLWRGGVLLLAVLAPALGAARIGRSITTGAVETEFSRWFQPIRESADHERGQPGVPPATHWTRSRARSINEHERAHDDEPRRHSDSPG